MSVLMLSQAAVMLSALLIILPLLGYQRGDSPHRPLAAGVAWLLAIAAAAVLVLRAFGEGDGLAQLGLNGVLLLSLLAHRGDLAALWSRRGPPGRGLRYVAGAVCLLPLFILLGRVPESWGAVWVNSVLAGALWVHRGNVVRLFGHGDASRLSAWLRRTSWHS